MPLFQTTIFDVIGKTHTFAQNFYMDELNEELRNQAKHLGLCNDWQRLWRKDWSKEKMVEMMYRGLDFCLKYHYPANDFLVKHFELDFLRKSNVFVDDTYSVCNPKQSLVLGNSKIIFRYSAWGFGNVYVRDNSSAKIFTRNKSFVIVHLFDNAHVEAEQKDKSKFVIIKHSTDVTIVADTNIKIREDYDYLKNE